MVDCTHEGILEHKSGAKVDDGREDSGSKRERSHVIVVSDDSDCERWLGPLEDNETVLRGANNGFQLRSSTPQL